MPRQATSPLPGRASYLLHIWCEEATHRPTWRASVTIVADGRRLGFPHPEAALRFLADSLREHQQRPQEER